MIAARKIGAPDATREKYVTTKKKPVLGGIEAQAPRAVTRNEQNAKRDATKFGLRRLLNQEIGLDQLCFEKEPQFFVKFGIPSLWNAARHLEALLILAASSKWSMCP